MESNFSTVDSSYTVQFITHLTFNQDEFLHNHTFYEIFYVTEGEINHILNGEKKLLSVGDMYILRLDDVHGFERMGECTHRDLVIHEPLFKAACDYIQPELFENIKKDGPIYLKLTTAQLANLEEDLAYIKFIPLEDKKRNYAIKSFVAHILGYIYFSREVINMQYPKLVLNMIQFLQDPTYIKEGIPAISKAINYNYIYVCRIFKKYMNMTITEYLTMKRLDLAKLYLSTSKLTITEISKEVGFNYPYRFNQLFKEHNNCTPKQYRKKYFQSEQ